MGSSVWPVHVDPDHLYFVTTRAVQGAHVFRRPLMRRILVDSLNTARILGQMELYAFVLMPNHVHFIARCLEAYNVVDVVREFKKATSNLVLRQYEAEGNQQVLDFFAAAVRPAQKQRYAVWEDEYQAKNVFSPEFLVQKLDYVHHNPVQPHWRLAHSPEAYPWSSARFYVTGERALIPVSDARELLA